MANQNDRVRWARNDDEEADEGRVVYGFLIMICLLGLLVVLTFCF